MKRKMTEMKELANTAIFDEADRQPPANTPERAAALTLVAIVDEKHGPDAHQVNYSVLWGGRRYVVVVQRLGRNVTDKEVVHDT